MDIIELFNEKRDVYSDRQIVKVDNMQSEKVFPFK